MAMAPGMTSDSSHRGSICLWGKERSGNVCKQGASTMASYEPSPPHALAIIPTQPNDHTATQPSCGPIMYVISPAL